MFLCLTLLCNYFLRQCLPVSFTWGLPCPHLMPDLIGYPLTHERELVPNQKSRHLSVAPLTFVLFGLCCSYYLTAPIWSLVSLKRPLWSSPLMFWDWALFKSKQWSEHDKPCGRAGLEELLGSLTQWLLCFQTHSSDAALPLWDVSLTDCRILTK